MRGRGGMDVLADRAGGLDRAKRGGSWL